MKTGAAPDLPEIEPESEFLVGYLFEAGPVSVAGMGTIPLTWTDLRAWQAGAGLDLPPWQQRLLRRLSGEYLDESHKAEARDAPPPWVVVPDRDKIAKHVKSFLRN